MVARTDVNGDPIMKPRTSGESKGVIGYIMTVRLRLMIGDFGNSLCSTNHPIETVTGGLTVRKPKALSEGK